MASKISNVPKICRDIGDSATPGLPHLCGRFPLNSSVQNLSSEIRCRYVYSLFDYDPFFPLSGIRFEEQEGVCPDSEQTPSSPHVIYEYQVP